MEFSTRTLELRRNGAIVRLQAQPAKILALLLSRPGELVTREEVRQELWGGPLSYDFDDALNHAVRNLRTVLGDDAAAPRFVETVPRRGYRFIAKVRTVQSAEVQQDKDAPDPEKGNEQTPAVAQVAASRGRRTWNRYLIAAAVLVSVSCLVGLMLAARTPERPQVTGVVQLTHFGLAAKAVSDGQRLYVLQERGGHSTLVEFPMTGGAEGTPIATPFRNVLLHDISRDHKSLLISSFEKFGDPWALWVLPLDGSSPRRLGDIFAFSAAWSPDGSRIAFAGSTSHLPEALYVVNADGSNVRKLSDVGGPIDGWSPDGSVVRFTRTNDATGGTSIWEASADGKGVTPFLPQFHNREARWGEGQCCGAWTPDGRYFLFRQAAGASVRLWENSESTSFFHSDPKPSAIYAPPFAVGGMQVLATSRHAARAIVTGYKDDRELMVYEHKKGWFSPLLQGISALHISWSRDRRYVSYVSMPDLSLWRANADGSGRVKLLSAPIQAYYSEWSPDGSRISAHILLPGKPGKVCIVPAAGGPPEILFANEPTSEDGVSWSPDGQVLMFARTRLDAAQREISSNIWTLDLKSRKLTKVPGSDDLYSPSWSPDGRYIVAGDGMLKRLMLYDFSTQKWKQVASGVYLFGLHWSHDSKFVYYQDSRLSENQPIFRVNIATGKVQQVASREQLLDATDVARFAFLGVNPEDEPVITIVRSRADVYALRLFLP